LQGYPAVRPDLDLVEQEDQLTHELSLQEEINPEITLGMPCAICYLLLLDWSTFTYVLYLLIKKYFDLIFYFIYYYLPPCSDIFKADPNFPENEKRYEELRKTLLGEESEDEDASDAASDDDDDEEEDDESEEEDEEEMKIKDETETNLVNLRRTIYLTIMSSVDFEEAGHKLLKIKLEPGQEVSGTRFSCCINKVTLFGYFLICDG
jgi:pre-mRNA-splicing factor CWC22